MKDMRIRQLSACGGAVGGSGAYMERRSVLREHDWQQHGRGGEETVGLAR